MFTGRWNWLFVAFATPIALLLLHQVFATTWSNKCDPGNAQFYLMKYDEAANFRPQGELFTWENDGPDNSWLCSDASLSVSHVGANVNAMFDATRADLSRDGWVGGKNLLKDVDRSLQALDKALEASDEAGCTSALSGNRALEVEIVVEDPSHTCLIEG